MPQSDNTVSLYVQAEAPNVSPSLEWTYGYRGKDTRSNLYSLPTGEICYYVASLAVLYSPESQTQRHYRGHTEDIECLATHPQLALCATGQASSQHSPGQDSAHVQVRLQSGVWSTFTFTFTLPFTLLNINLGVWLLV